MNISGFVVTPPVSKKNFLLLLFVFLDVFLILFYFDFYVRPSMIVEGFTQIFIPPKEPVHAYYEAIVGPNESIELNGLRVHFIVPTPLLSRAKNNIVWQIDGISKERPLSPAMHGTAMHVYATPDNHSVEFDHSHPTSVQPGYVHGALSQEYEFVQPGLWNVVAQFTEGENLYVIRSTIFVEGEDISVEPALDFSKEQNVGSLRISLETNAVIKKSRPTYVYFVTEDIYDPDYKAHKNRTVSSNNIIFSLEGEPTIWNEHQDGSVIQISSEGKGGVLLKDRHVGDNFLGYDQVEFREAGIWRVRYEFPGGPVEFYIQVEE